MTQVLEILDREFKTTIINNMLKYLMEKIDNMQY